MRELVTIPQVAKLLGVSVQRAYELARCGIIPSVRMGRQVRVDLDCLEEWVRSGGTNSVSPLPTENKKKTL